MGGRGGFREWQAAYAGMRLALRGRGGRGCRCKNRCEEKMALEHLPVLPLERPLPPGLPCCYLRMPYPPGLLLLPAGARGAAAGAEKCGCPPDWGAAGPDDLHTTGGQVVWLGGQVVWLGGQVVFGLVGRLFG